MQRRYPNPGQARGTKVTPPQSNNLRRIIKSHLKHLLRCRNEYWRQRYTVRWVQLGDEPTKFFHAAATERYWRNAITALQDEEGRELTQHEEKAVVLWNTFKHRMGCSSSPDILFNLEELSLPTMDLSHLAEPFAKEEIDQVIKTAK
jgi:hypothetical protein